MRTIIFYNKILTFQKESKAKEKENNTSFTTFIHSFPLFFISSYKISLLHSLKNSPYKNGGTHLLIPFFHKLYKVHILLIKISPFILNLTQILPT